MELFGLIFCIVVCVGVVVGAFYFLIQDDSWDEDIQVLIESIEECFNDEEDS